MPGRYVTDRVRIYGCTHVCASINKYGARQVKTRESEPESTELTFCHTSVIQVATHRISASGIRSNPNRQ
jgi:hypothetical protein